MPYGALSETHINTLDFGAFPLNRPLVESENLAIPGSIWRYVGGNLHLVHISVHRFTLRPSRRMLERGIKRRRHWSEIQDQRRETQYEFSF